MSYSFLGSFPSERKRLLVAMAILAIIVLILDHVGHGAHLYATDYFEYDKVVHFTAGAFCGAFGLWLFQPSGIIKEMRWTLCVTFLLSFWVGFIWEIYEFVCNHPDITTMLYWGDTGADMIADVSGGLTAGLMHQKKG